MDMIDKNIKHFRKAKGMSQEEMAVKLNVVCQYFKKTLTAWFFQTTLILSASHK